ncbi:general substrate transporter [Thozetella sp. PMI_491]|nr:general substrate transporter [Thozetella sp. PMI_491]
MLGLGKLALRESFNTKLTLTVLLIAISQFNFGFDQQGFSSTQAMPAFAAQFGNYNEKTKTYALDTVWVSMFNSFTYLGQAFGVILGSYVSRRYGRRMCMFSMSILALVCATIVITSKTRNQILAGRVLNYIYIGMELSVVPVFQSEITPQQARGFIVGTYQTSLFSPRWLVLQDRQEEARENLRLLRLGKFTEEQIEAELRAIVLGIEHEHEKGSFFEIFHPTVIRRTMVVVGANFFLQATGQNFTSTYGALFAASLGTINPFTVTIMLAVVNTCTAIAAQVLTDRLGRRYQVLFGACVQAAATITMGGLGTAANQTSDIKAGIVAMMVVFTFGYSIGWAPTAHIISAEIPSTRMRDMTYRTASVLNISVQFAVTFSLPYLLNAPYANLGSKVGFIFGSISAVSVVFAYFFIPNVSGRTLEEIDRLFESGVPIRKFQNTELDMVASEKPGVPKDEEGKLGGCDGVPTVTEKETSLP